MNTAAIQRRVESALKRYGQVVQLGLKPPPEDIDPVTDPVSDDTPKMVSAYAVLGAAPSGQAYEEAYLAGTLERSSLRSVLLAPTFEGEALPRMPYEGDVLVFGGQTWAFIGTTVVEPSGTALLYRGVVRG